MKKILVVYYTQSGQLKQIAENFCAPLVSAGHTVEFVRVQMKNEFPFPWTKKKFFDAMPESVLGIPAELSGLQFKEEKYDLIVFAHQPWYLSPSIPATSVLNHPEFQKRVKNTPVVTLIAARNMWLSAQERVKKMIKQSGGKLVGNVVFVDRVPNLVSAVTIQHWMFTGRKDRYLSFFPKPGVAEEEINTAGKFGEKVAQALTKGELDGLQKQLMEMKAVEVKTSLMFIESRAPKIFSIWANTIIKKKNRERWLKIFQYYLSFTLFIIAPLILIIYTVLIRPLTQSQIRERKKYFSGVN